MLVPVCAIAAAAPTASSRFFGLIFRMLTQVAGAPCLLALPPLAASSTIVPTTARPTTHPARKAGPFTRPFGVASIRTTAMIGTGLSGTPMPKEKT